MIRNKIRSHFGPMHFGFRYRYKGEGNDAGFLVSFASQDAYKFLTAGTNVTNFAELAECGVHFSPHTLTDAQQRMILGGVIHTKFKKAEAALRLQGKLVTSAARQFWRDGGK